MTTKTFFSTLLLSAVIFVFSACNDPEPTPTDGVVINGITWATRNVDAPGTFADNPQDAGMFFQWNRRQGWSATGEVTDWDSSLPEGTEWENENDPCPAGWRVPTIEELQSLYNAGHTWIANWNDTDINGRVFGTYPNQIFLPAVGFRYRVDGSLHLVGAYGNYWSSTKGDISEFAWDLHFNSGRVNANGHWWRTNGLSVRCVAE